jgi:hypothetical protein
LVPRVSPGFADAFFNAGSVLLDAGLTALRKNHPIERETGRERQRQRQREKEKERERKRKKKRER